VGTSRTRASTLKLPKKLLGKFGGMNGATRWDSEAPDLASVTKLLKALRSKKNGSSNSPAITRPPPVTARGTAPSARRRAAGSGSPRPGARLVWVTSGWFFADCLTSWKFCRPKASGSENVNWSMKLSASAAVFCTRTSYEQNGWNVAGPIRPAAGPQRHDDDRPVLHRGRLEEVDIVDVDVPLERDVGHQARRVAVVGPPRRFPEGPATQPRRTTRPTRPTFDLGFSSLRLPDANLWGERTLLLKIIGATQGIQGL